MLSAEIPITIQFYDLDPMQVVWHGHYARFLEQARCALLDRIGYNYQEMARSGFAWPIVDMRLKFVRPIRMAEVIVVSATLVEFEHRLKLDYRITRQGDGTLLTRATTIQVAVNMATGELMLECPPALVDRVTALIRRET